MRLALDWTRECGADLDWLRQVKVCPDEYVRFDFFR